MGVLNGRIQPEPIFLISNPRNWRAKTSEFWFQAQTFVNEINSPSPPAHAEKGAIISIGREVTGRTKDGREFPLDLSVSVVRLGKHRVFIATVRNITKRKTAEAALSQSREQLRLLAAHLQSVREDERKRIAQEVHEVLGQALSRGLRWIFPWMITRIGSNQKPVLAMARSSVESVNETIQMVRRIATELRPGVLDNFGLVAAIEWQAGEFQKRTGNSVPVRHYREQSCSRAGTA